MTASARTSQSTRISLRVACAALAISVCHGVTAAPPKRAIERYDGVASSPGDQKPLYLETHWLYLEGAASDATRLVLYRCPEGTPFARKVVRPSGTASSPDFDFVDGRDGHREGVRGSAMGREVYWQERRGVPVVTRSLDPGPDVVIDAGFDAYVRAQWTAISSAAPLNARLLLPSRASTLQVDVEDATTPADRAASQRRIEVRPDAWYAFAAPKLTLVYGEDRKLREFSGIGTIRDERGRHHTVTIRFPAGQDATGIDADEIEAAHRIALTGRCAP